MGFSNCVEALWANIVFGGSVFQVVLCFGLVWCVWRSCLCEGVRLLGLLVLGGALWPGRFGVLGRLVVW